MARQLGGQARMRVDIVCLQEKGRKGREKENITGRGLKSYGRQFYDCKPTLVVLDIFHSWGSKKNRRRERGRKERSLQVRLGEARGCTVAGEGLGSKG